MKECVGRGEQISMKECVGCGDRIRGRLHAKRTRFRTTFFFFFFFAIYTLSFEDFHQANRERQKEEKMDIAEIEDIL